MEKQEKQLRWGICTAGFISFDFADAIYSMAVEQQKLIAVAARDLERAKSFADKFQIPKAYGSYAALANDPEVNIVYVGSTTNAHYEQCKLFLNAGKHVLCEKALTCATWQAEDLIALAKQKHLFFMEGMWTRCFPLYPKIRELIGSGALGDVHFVDVHFMYDSAGVKWGDRLVQVDSGAGAMWDMGVYVLQFADYVFGEKPLSVKAVGKVQDGVDVAVTTTLQYSNERFATLTVSCVSQKDIVAVVHGSKAKLTVEEPFYTPIKMTVTQQDGEKRTFEAPLPEVKYPTNYPNSAGFVYEAQHVYDCVSRGLLESNLVPHSLTLWMQNAIDECLRQIGRTNQPKRNDAASQ